MEHSPRFLAVVADAKKRIREITIGELKARQGKGESPLLIDVREDREWEKGRIRGAIHIGRGVLERDIEGLVPEPGREIILYCGGGFRSALAADSLADMGYTAVLSLAGGWRGWAESGGPAER